MARRASVPDEYRSIKRRILLGFCLALLAMVGVAFLSYWSIYRLQEAQSSIAHTHEVLQRVNELTSSVEASRLERTRKEIGTALGRGVAAWRDLRRLTRDNPAQQKRLFELKPAVSSRPGAAPPLLRAMAAEETRLLEQRQLAAEDSGRLSMHVIAAGCVIALLFMLVSVHLIYRDLDRRASRDKEIQRLRDEFMAMVTHELRAPVTSIIGAIDLFEGDPEDPKARDFIRIARRNGELMMRLVDDFLDLQKLEYGRMEFKVETIDIAAVVKEATVLYRPYGYRHEVKFAFSSDRDAVFARADRSRIVQVLGNLLSNAAKFSPRGGEVEVKVARASGKVRVSVSDRGPGISEEFRGQIFQRFAQDGAGGGGTGLGLSVAKAIIERLGGRIGFDTRPGQGTTFYFELPEAAKAGAAA